MTNVFYKCFLIEIALISGILSIFFSVFINHNIYTIGLYMIKRILLLVSIMGVMQGAQQEAKESGAKKAADKTSFFVVYGNNESNFANTKDIKTYRVECETDITFQELSPKIGKYATDIFTENICPLIVCGQVKPGECRNFPLKDKGTLTVIRSH